MSAFAQQGIPGIAGVLPGELIVDLFAGGGGASLGIERALGRSPDHAVNHWQRAIECHERNHPATQHHRTSVWEIDPHDIAQGQPVGLLHLSPDCTHHSRAKGDVPVKKELRSLPWVAIRWAAAVAPRVITLENVPEIVQWGPLKKVWRRNRKTKLREQVLVPDKKRRGKTWEEFLSQLRALGYHVEHRNLQCQKHGDPTSRERLFLVARRDDQPIAWPKPSHGPGLKPERTAADHIDWSIPCPSIFLTKQDVKCLGLRCKRPLAENSLRRIARGIVKYVLEDPQPFIVPLRGTSPSHTSVHSIHQPLSTISGGGTHHGLVAPFLAKYYGDVVGHGCKQPIGTITGIDHHALVACHLTTIDHRGAGDDVARSLAQPLGTTTSKARHAMVAAFLTQYYSEGGQDQRADRPLQTITGTARHALVTVTIAGEEYVLVDIGFRMLEPHELAACQGFPADYILTGSKKDQTKLIGNSVPPGTMEALIRANLIAELVAA